MNQTDGQIRAEAMEFARRQAAAYALVLKRAEVLHDDVETARSVLRKLALVELDDVKDALIRSEADNLVGDANRLEVALFRGHYRQGLGLT